MKIVDIAKTYIGVREGTKEHRDIIDYYNIVKYAGDYAMTYADPWCAAFVTVCAKQAGVKFTPACNTEIIKSNMASNMTNYPQVGGLVFFDWDGDGITDHIGIVSEVNGDKFSSIEGNTSDMVAERHYNIGDTRIDCFTRSLENDSGKTPAQVYEEKHPTAIGTGNGNKQLFYPQLEIENKNKYVLLMKNLLALHNYPIEDISEYFDKATEENLKKFQNDCNVAAAPGVCGINTWRALMKGDFEVDA